LFAHKSLFEKKQTFEKLKKKIQDKKETPRKQNTFFYCAQTSDKTSIRSPLLCHTLQNLKIATNVFFVHANDLVDHLKVLSFLQKRATYLPLSRL